MAYELKDGEGSLWKNEDRKSDSHPHAKGQLKINGVIYWVDAWTNETPAGKKFQKLSVKRKEQPITGGPSAGSAPPRQLNDEPEDSEIPF